MTDFKDKNRNSEQGSIFTILLGAVALAGIVSVATFNLLSGPIATSARISNKTMANNQMMATSKIAIMDAVNSAAAGDCDADNFIEPAEWRDAAGAGPDGVVGSDGGGFIPTSLGATVTDPWGTDYGYCVWDVGTVSDANLCGASGDNIERGGIGDVTNLNRLDGTNDPNAGNTDTKYVLAFISAGPDRIFQTTCLNYVNTTTAILVGGGDDIVHKYTYAEAGEATSALWSLSTADSNIAQIGGTGTEVTIDRTTGLGTFLALTSTGRITADDGIKLADQTATIDGECTGPTAGLTRYNTGTTNLDVCDGTNFVDTGLWTDNTTHISRSSAHIIDAVAGLPAALTGAGTRMMWIPDKWAFRAGEVTGTEWDTIGNHSAAFGKNNIAGLQSFSAGIDNTSSGQASTTFGQGNIASVLWSTAIGQNNRASGFHSIAMGYNNTASGQNAVAVGDNATASGANSFAWSSGSPLGETVAGNYAAAMGWGSKASGDSSFAFGTGITVSGIGSVGWQMDGTNFNCQNGGTCPDVSANETFSIIGGDFVVGSPQLADDTVTGHDERMFFDKSKGAFRAGAAQAAQWDDISIGAHSAAFGYNSSAAGQFGFATGAQNVASGYASTALGQGNTASSSWAIAAGNSNTANNLWTYAIGQANTASGMGSMALGVSNTSSNQGAMTLGTSNTASSNYAMAVGYQNTVPSIAGYAFGNNNTSSGLVGSVAIGNYTTASASHSTMIGKGDTTTPVNIVNNTANSVGIGIIADGAGIAETPEFFVIDGGVGIAMIAPAHPLDVVGTAGLSTGTLWTNTSDRRLKDIHGDYEYGLDEISRLHTVRFNYKKDNPIGLPSDTPLIGFIAQEVEPIFPEAVNTRKDGYLDFNMHSINVAMVNAIQELKKENDGLNSELEQIRHDMDKVMNRVGLSQSDKTSAIGNISTYLGYIIPIGIILTLGGIGLFRRRK